MTTEDIDITRIPRSALLRLAVEDACTIGATPGYVLDMWEYHTPVGDNCHVCMAGAVIARRAGTDPGTYRVPGSFPEAVADTMRWIDLTRRGRTGSDAVCELIRGRFNNLLGRAPWSVYLVAADMLEAEENAT